LTQQFKKKGDRVIDLSGARVIFNDGWGLVRASSNLPQLVLRFEAKSQERLQQIEDTFREMLKSYPGLGSKWETG
jgi:phosphomannomutase/phosphoglucomutase